MSRPFAAVIGVLALLPCGCGVSASAGLAPGVRVAAAESFWGAIAVQLGGERASVRSIIVNPAQDPHSYEPTAADARTLATAQLAIVNGIGYDPWAPRLLAADPGSGRLVLTVGKLLGLEHGDNPHRWYDPADVEAVAAAITTDLQRLDPAHAAYYADRRRQFENQGLAEYHALIAQIRRRFAGVAVGASESIFALQAPALALDLVTPAGLMKAVSEGTEVTARDTVAAQRQITRHRIKVWVYNSQNSTPEVQQLNSLARAAGIPVVTITETLAPAGDSFEQWQVGQLAKLERALAQATGR